MPEQHVISGAKIMSEMDFGNNKAELYVLKTLFGNIIIQLKIFR